MYINKKLLIENGIADRKEDYLLEKDLNKTLIEYLLNNCSDSYGEKINKYDVNFGVTLSPKKEMYSQSRIFQNNRLI